MMTTPLMVGTVRICMDPESKDTSLGGMTSDTFQGVATLFTPTGPFKMEGARWHLLSQVFSSSEDIKTDLKRKRLLQESMHKDAKGRSFSWKVLRQTKLAVDATTYVEYITFLAPPFCEKDVRGDTGPGLWGARALGPRVVRLFLMKK